MKPLVVVPWLLVNGAAETARAREEAPKHLYTAEEDEKIKDRLRKLGYL